MICAYLRHNGHFKEVEEALKYYGNARTKNAKGVTIPSQRRYVCYYDQLLVYKLTYIPTMVLLRGFEIVTIPNMQNGTCSKYCCSVSPTSATLRATNYIVLAR